MRRLILSLCVISAVLVLAPGKALAHNSLDASSPATGAVLDTAPTEITWTFRNAVPLETLTVTLIDASGVRTELPGSTHGSAGEHEVVTPLPPLPPGEVSLRWRLVGPDGHPVTDRVTFTVQAPVSATTAPPAPATTAPVAVVATTTPSPTTPTISDSAQPDESSTWSTPRALRWLLRGLSYLAIMVAAGVILTHTLVLRAADWSGTRRWLEPALAIVGVTALLQLLVVASDVGGRPLWRSGSSINEAVEYTDAGMAFLLRLILAVSAWLLFVHAPPRVTQVRNELLVMISLVFLATWSFAGHSASMRWPALGLPLDVVHHGAAAAWIGGLAIVGLIALPRLAPEDVRPVMLRFSRLASVSVAAIVVTGLVQAVRLVGSPRQLLEVNHGKLLAVKLAVLVGMLALADVNRRRVTARLSTAGASARLDIDGLRRGMALELVIGLVIIGVTAAMVVSPPATSAAAATLTMR
jgi:copper transport protein